MEEMIREAEAKPAAPSAESIKKMAPKIRGSKNKTKAGAPIPFPKGSFVEMALQNFPSRIEDSAMRGKLEELSKQVRELFGGHAVDPTAGVYHFARLYLTLCANEMEVSDAKSKTVLHSNARVEYKMDEKRARIVEGDLNFTALPGLEKVYKFQPGNRYLGRNKDGCIVSYNAFGAELSGLGKAISPEEYVDTVIWGVELKAILRDAFCAVEVR